MGKGFCGKPVFTPKGGRVSRLLGVAVGQSACGNGSCGRGSGGGVTSGAAGAIVNEPRPRPFAAGLRVRGFRGFGGGGQVREAERGEVG